MQHRGYATFASALAACRLGGAGALLSSMLESTRRCAGHTPGAWHTRRAHALARWSPRGDYGAVLDNAVARQAGQMLRAFRRGPGVPGAVDFAMIMLKDTALGFAGLKFDNFVF